MFMLYLIGLTAMGGFIFITGLAIPRRWDWLNQSFQTRKNVPTFIVKGLILLAGAGMLIGSINYWKDVPYYRNQEYSTVSGKPSIVDVYSSSKGGGEDIVITIKDISLDIYPYPVYDDPQDLKKRYFTVRYLPHTKWVIDYELD